MLCLSKFRSLFGVQSGTSAKDFKEDGFVSTPDLLSVFHPNLSRKRLMEDFFFLSFSAESSLVRSEGELFVIGFFVIKDSSKGGGISIKEVGVDRALDDRGEHLEKLSDEEMPSLCL